MIMFIAKQKAVQPEFWIAAEQVVSSAKSGFYAKLEETLESFGFAAKVRALCAPAYDKSGVGRPGIDPVVYLKMVMVGFFEDLPSERAIAARCADSLAIRAFLKYELNEKTPEHSSFRPALRCPTDCCCDLVEWPMPKQKMDDMDDTGVGRAVTGAPKMRRRYRPGRPPMPAKNRC